MRRRPLTPGWGGRARLDAPRLQPPRHPLGLHVGAWAPYPGRPPTHAIRRRVRLWLLQPPQQRQRLCPLPCPWESEGERGRPTRAHCRALFLGGWAGASNARRPAGSTSSCFPSSPTQLGVAQFVGIPARRRRLGRARGGPVVPSKSQASPWGGNVANGPWASDAPPRDWRTHGRFGAL
jgi:hypothetical protein